MVSKMIQGPELKNEIKEQCLGEFFFEMTKKHGDKICQIDAITGEEETFNCVRLRSIRVALHMKKSGIGPKDIISVCSRNSLDAAIPVLAATFLGALAANLDPTLSVTDTKYLISLTKPKMIFVEEDLLPLIEESLGDSNELNVNTIVVVFGSSAEYPTFKKFLNPDGEEDKFRPASGVSHEVALIFFSSGTTGFPKAICLSHKYFLDNPFTCDINSDALLNFTTLYGIGTAWFLVLSFFGGGYRVLMRHFDAELTFQVIEKYKVTFVQAQPSYTYPLVNLETSKNFDTSFIHVFGVMGYIISASQVEKIRALFGPAKVLMFYGMTEVGIATAFDIKEHMDLIISKPMSCGKAATGNMIKAKTWVASRNTGTLVKMYEIEFNSVLQIVNPNSDEILGPNQHGEIRIKNDHLMLGYHNMDSSQCFDEDGFYKTGDVGYYDEDECFYVVDRIKEMFKYKSWHILPSLIEDVLSEHPQISEAVVFGVPHEEYGDLPTASVVLKKNSNVTKEQILDYVAERVSDRERLRGGIFIVDCIPKTPTGKVSRRKARENVINSVTLLNE